MAPQPASELAKSAETAQRAAENARAVLAKAAKTAEGASKAKEKLAAASAASGGGGGEVTFTFKNEKWVTCDACKTKVRNDTINGKCSPKTAREVARHLRKVFSSAKWLRDHAHMKINEMVVFYIDKNEKEPS